METILYRVLKRCIERKNYESVEDMAEKVSLIYANGQLTKDQYEELMVMLEA